MNETDQQRAAYWFERLKEVFEARQEEAEELLDHGQDCDQLFKIKVGAHALGFRLFCSLNDGKIVSLTFMPQASSYTIYIWPGGKVTKQDGEYMNLFIKEHKL